MATIKLSTGNTLNINSGSSSTAIFVSGTPEEVGAAVSAISQESLNGAVITDTPGEITINQMVYTGFSGSVNDDGTESATFSLRAKTDMEKMTEQITELQTALAEIAEGGAA